MTLFDTTEGLSDSLDNLIQSYKEMLCGVGCGSQQILLAIQKFVTSVTKTVNEICPSLPVFGVVANETSIQKSTVLAAFDKFYDTVIAPFDLPMIPDFIENTYIDPAVRAFLRQQAENVFDTVTSLLGWYAGTVAESAGACQATKAPVFAVL